MVTQTRSRSASSLTYQPLRRPEWQGLSAQEILERHPIGKTPPLQVLNLLITLFNREHTARQKEVSFKTRHERAAFLRRFYRDLQRKAGFKLLPDPRNLGERHVQAIVQVWQQEQLAPATIQTYFSFLRGLCQWLGKNGLVRPPAHYGLKPEQFKRHEAAQRDKSWTAQHVAIDAVIDRISQADAYVGAALRLIRAFGLRRKEAIMFRPHASVVSFEATGLPQEKKLADQYVRIKAGSKGGRERFVALDSVACLAAIAHAQVLVTAHNGHMGHPSHSLARALRRFDYVIVKFGVTRNVLGVTAHGLRHEALIARFEVLTGQAAPVRGGDKISPDIDKPARQEVAEMAGHARLRVSNAYLGSTPKRK